MPAATDPNVGPSIAKIVREVSPEMPSSTRQMDSVAVNSLQAQEDTKMKVHDPNAEIDYSMMIDSVTDTEIITLDPQGRVKSWNKGAQTLKGYRAEEVIGQPLTLFYTDEDRASGLAERELNTAA